MKKVLFLITCIASLNSCLSSKYFYEHNSHISSINDSTLIKMEGDYGGEPVNIDEIKNHPNVSPLEKIFFEPFYIYKWEEERDYSGDIKIKVLSKNKLEISLYKNGKFKRKILKGKITNNFFEVKTRRKVIGFPLLYFMLDIEKLMLGISNEGHLIVACRRYHFGSLFVLGGDSRHSIPLSYFPKKE